MTRRAFASIAAGLLPLRVARAADDLLALEARSREASGEPSEQILHWAPAKAAIIICDMWDDHWCKSSAKRVGELVPRMNQVIAAARNLGVSIVHAPSETMAFYADMPQRKRILAAPHTEPPVEIPRWCYLDPEREGALPIDDEHPCDDTPESEFYTAWSRQHAGIDIAAEDVISDQGQEIFNYFRQKGIENVALMGVHTNKCVLGRSFGIRSMVRLGFNVVLVRDLTDSMYDPRDKPYVSHDEGTQLVIEHIEKHWAPSIESDDLTKLEVS